MIIGKGLLQKSPDSLLFLSNDVTTINLLSIWLCVNDNSFPAIISSILDPSFLFVVAWAALLKA